MDHMVIGRIGVIGMVDSLMEIIATITLAAAANLKTMFSPLVVTELHLTLKTAVIKASSEAVTQII